MKKKVVLMILSVLAVIALAVGCAGGSGNGAGKSNATVTFDFNYEGSVPIVQTVEIGDNASMPDEPTRNGYTFGGWYLKTADNSFETEPFDFIGTAIEHDITVYAKWNETVPEILPKPTDVQVVFSDGVITVTASGTGLEYSFNDGGFTDENTFVSGYAARVKVEVRRKATENAYASESVAEYITTSPDSSEFTISDKQNTYRAITVTVENSELYEYNFNGSGEWLTGTDFDNLPEKRQQNVEIRVVASGDYPASEPVTKTFEIFVDDDYKSKVQHPAYSSDEHSVISDNEDAEGLCGEESIHSIKIEDKDISGYNEWLIRIPAGYSAFAADVMVIVNTETAITKALPITNTSGIYLTAVELNKWQKIYAKGGDWQVAFNFTALNANGIEGTAVIYLDNIVYYTDEQVENGELDSTVFVENSVGTGDGDAIDDMESKFDITLGTGNSLYKNFRDRYILQTDAASTNGSHLIKVKKPSVSDISAFNGISFAVDMQLNGSGVGEIPLYLVKKGVSYTSEEAKNLSDFSDSTTFTKIHGYKVERVGGSFNGSEIVKIDAETLTSAGYDLTDLSDLTFVFRDVELTGGWWNVLNMYFYDFRIY